MASLDSDDEGSHFAFLDDDDDDYGGAGTNTSSSAAAAATTPHSNKRRISSDNGGGMLSPSARIKIKVPPIPTLSNEVLNSIGGKLYPDLRHAFIKRLLGHARDVRRVNYKKNSFDVTVRAITVLSLHPHPIRSADVCKRIGGIGPELLTVLKDAVNAEGSTPFVPARGKFSAVAPAAVVAMSQYVDANPDEPLCSMEELIRRTNQLLDPRANAAMNRDSAYYLDKNNMDPGWSQIKKICSANQHAGIETLLKERKRKGRSTSGTVFELTDKGRQEATKLKGLLEAGPVEPGPLRQLAASEVSEAYKDVTMSVDFREGGGGGHGLHKMCNLLETICVPYVVRELKIADYVYFVGNKLAPYLVERKSIEDIAHSIRDGRWQRQQRKMRMAQYVLGGGSARKCHIGYLIEGDASRQVVHGGNIGRASWGQSEQDIEDAIKSLPKLGFFVIRTKSIMGSMNKLAELAQHVSWMKQNGSLDANITYEDFLRRMKLCDKKEGDPPTDEKHQYPSAPVFDRHNAHYERRQSQSPIVVASEAVVAASPAGTTAAAAAGAASAPASNSSALEAELQKLSVGELKKRCKDRDENVGGKKGDLIARLLKPRKPELLIVRKRNGDHVPKVPSCNAALLVALLLHTRPGEGKTKEELMILADDCGVSTVPMDQKNGHYDGWAGMSELKKGDPALVCMKKKLHCLTTHPQGSSGRDVARALHILAHREGICECGNHNI